MKLLKLSANKPTFKQVAFRDGFNFIVAEKSDTSGDKDSTNGLGKSLLLEIVDFCLGSNPSVTIKKEEMTSWVFSLDVEIDGSKLTFSRSVENPNYVRIQGARDVIGIANESDDEITLDVFKAHLGETLFGLNEKSLQGKKNKPSYRSLISYFMRTDSTAFSNTFAYFAQQPAWSRQVNNAYLLGLDWELSVKLTQLKSKLDRLEDANKAIEEGAFSDFGGTVGELESEKINLETALGTKTERLKKFQVYEDYANVQKKADSLTKEMHKLLNVTNLNMQVISKYQENLSGEHGEQLRVEDIYKGAGVIFPDNLKHTLRDVENFHKTIVSNRKQYLKNEIDNLASKNKDLEAEIKKLSKERTSYMSILDSHGALEEYSLLQSEVNRQEAKIADIESKVARLTEIEDTISSLNVDVEKMVKSMRKDYSERLPTLASAVKMFNSNSEYLYSQSGKLSVNITKEGYKFKVDIKKSGSDGVGNMKVLCYDLMLAEYWSTIRNKTVPLFHDSKIFADVDPRQVAKAFELAQEKADNFGFQYICSMNSSYIPYEFLSESFKSKLDDMTIVRYSDKDDTGTLLGITF
jgi:uncharacterized protein YydD (DUF2326 family)